MNNDDNVQCTCNKKALLLQVKKEGPNTGRWFYACASKTCKFFKWSSSTAAAASTSSSGGRSQTQTYNNRRTDDSDGDSQGVRNHRATFKNDKSKKNNKDGDDEDVPSCPVHGQESVVLRQVSKKDSPHVGRHFWTCSLSTSSGGGCKLFAWCSNPEAYPQHQQFRTSNENMRTRPNNKNPQRESSSTRGASMNVELEACSQKQFLQAYGITKHDAKQNNGKSNANREGSSSSNSGCNTEDSVKETDETADALVICKFSDEPTLELINRLKKCTNNSIYFHAPSTNVHAFSLIGYHTILHVLSESDSIGHITEIPNAIANILIESVKEHDENFKMNWNKIPQKLCKNMMPFQKQGVEFAIRREGRVLIGDEMGLGKTIQAIAAASFYFSEWPLLVLCPSSLRYNWKSEIAKWMPHLDCSDDDDSDIYVVQDGKADKLNALVNIVSYTLASREPLLSIIKKQKFKVVIVDECHYLKSGESQRTKKLCPLITNAGRAILLSGTASPSRPIELYTQFKSISSSKGLKKVDYGMRYCDLKQNGFGSDYSGASHLSELNLLLSTVMIRRLKSDVLSDLPPKKRSAVYIQADANQLNEIKQLKSKSGDGSKYIAAVRNSNTAEIYKTTGIAKLNSIKKYVKDMLRDSHKFLIFAHHTHVLDGIEEEVQKCKKEYIRIDGSTPKDERLERTNHFRTTPECLVAILSITAAGTGLTFTPCSTILFAELHWTPGILAQAEDRCHRIGQTSFVDIRYLLAKGTADDTIWPMIKSKLDVVGQALDDDLQQGKKQFGSGTMSSSVFLAGQTTLQFEKKTESEQSEDTVESEGELDFSILDVNKTTPTVEDVSVSTTTTKVEATKSSGKKRSSPSPSAGATKKRRKTDKDITQKNTLLSYFAAKK